MFKILFFIIIISVKSYGQGSNVSRDTAARFVDSLLNSGPIFYSLQNFDYPKEYKEIIDKLKLGIEANPKWYFNYLRVFRNSGAEIQYHKNFGISKVEFDKLITKVDLIPQLFDTKVQYGTIEKGQGKIILYNTSDSAAFKQALINLKEGLVILDSEELVLTYKFDSTNLTPYGRWFGYSWKAAESNAQLVKTRPLLNLKSTYFDIARIIPNGKTLIRVRKRVIKDGNEVLNQTWIFYINYYVP